MKKILPKMTTDEEVESLLEQDLSDYLHEDNFKPVSFEFKPKDKTVNLRVSPRVTRKSQNSCQKRRNIVSKIHPKGNREIFG